MSDTRVPDGWKQISLGQLGETFNGLTKKTAKDFGRGEYFITYMQVFKNTLSDRSQCDSVEIIEGEKQSQVQYGDILFTTSSETPEEIGYTSVFLETDWFPYLNSFCFGIRPKTKDLLPEFADYLFRGNEFRTAIKPLAQGSTRYNLSKENLKKLVISFPSLPEQQNIASILTAVDDVIEKTQSQINKLQDLKKGTMNELLTRGIGHTEFKDSPVGRIPREWDVQKLNSLSVKVGDGIHTTPIYSENGDYPFINGNNLKSGKIIFGDSTKTVDEEEFNKHRIELSDTTILMSINGTIGNLAYFNGEAVVLGKSAAFIRLNDSVSKVYIFYLLDSLAIQQYFESELTGTTIRNLSLRSIRETPVPLPSIDEQKKIASILSSLDNSTEKKQRKLEQTKSLKKSLMQDLLTGKVRVPLQ